MKNPEKPLENPIQDLYKTQENSIQKLYLKPKKILLKRIQNQWKPKKASNR